MGERQREGEQVAGEKREEYKRRHGKREERGGEGSAARGRGEARQAGEEGTRVGGAREEGRVSGRWKGRGVRCKGRQ